MKKIVAILLVALVVTSGAFAKKAKKVKPGNEPFVFNYTKDFYPGILWAIVNTKGFAGSTLTKADIIKNEYTLEGISVALNTMKFTMKISIAQNGQLAYEYSDIYGTKDGKKYTTLGIAKGEASKMEKGLSNKLKEVFSNDAIYNASKNEVFSEPAILLTLINGITEIRAAKFTEMVKGAKLNMKVRVGDAQMNNDGDLSDYKYYISTYADTGIRKIYIVYYTNDDSKASCASGDDIQVVGIVNNFARSKYFSGDLCFWVTDDTQ